MVDDTLSTPTNRMLQWLLRDVGLHALHIMSMHTYTGATGTAEDWCSSAVDYVAWKGASGELISCLKPERHSHLTAVYISERKAHTLGFACFFRALWPSPHESITEQIRSETE